MLEVQGPMQSHVSTGEISEKSYVFTKEHLEGFCQLQSEDNAIKNTTFYSDEPNAVVPKQNENASTIDGSEYVIMEKRPENQSTAPIKSAASGENRTSVFDDSDYDEVIDFLTSSTLDSTSDAKPDCIGKSDSTNDVNIDFEPNSAFKRSSASSSVSNTSSMTSGVESGEEKPSNSKYAELDLGKILHTRRRIHKILQTPLNGANDQCCENEPQSNSSSSAKKKSYLSKRSTHYGTIGGTRSKSSSSVSRNSRPPSAGDEILNGSIMSSDFFSPDPLRTKLDVSSNFYSLKRISKSELTRKKSSASEEEDKIAEQESKRWSKLSSSSQNSDKAPLSPHKGPWKAFRKFVNNSNSSSTRTLSHDEIKATIHLQHSSSNGNNNNLSRSQSREFLDVADSSKNSFSLSRNPESSMESQDKEVPRRHTNSLLRRFSRRSRSRSARRKSLPVDNALGVRPIDSKQNEILSSQTARTPRQVSEGPSNENSRIENMVMSSLQSRQDEDEKKKPEEKPRKSHSIRKRLMLFTRKRSSSQERKTILKENVYQPAQNESGQMNKALSFSSPQLSVFAVNSKSKQTATKLVF